MKRFLALALPAVVAVAGCSTSQAPGTKAAAPAAAPQPSATATPTPLPESPALAEDVARLELQKKFRATEAAVTGKSATGDDQVTPAPVVFVDPATGKKMERIPKNPALYVVRGRLYFAGLAASKGIPLVREDADAYYVEVKAEKPVAPQASPTPAAESLEGLKPIVEVPEEEAVEIVPPTSSVRIRFEEISHGLPNAGIWRDNFDVKDLDGDGRPEIVTPPARLSGDDIQAYKLNGKQWSRLPLKFDDPQQIGFEYGGVAVGDMDGDGRNDIIFGKHGGGPTIAYNKGKGLFRVETRGLPKLMTTRAPVVGDLDGDGRLDVLAVSDMPEAADIALAERNGNASARLPRVDGYLPGFDARGFLSRGGKYEEVHAGLEECCFGYNIGLMAPAPDGGNPFYVSSCRYINGTGMLYEFDPRASKWLYVGRNVVELYANHVGSAVGRYMGHPAAFVAVTKNTPPGASKNVTGDGLSIYYREGGVWKRTRIMKVIKDPSASQGLAVGDLNGDGLDDVVYADDGLLRVRVFFQTAKGDFEELASDLEPTYTNHSSAIRLADVDGDKRLDVVLMTHYLTGDESRAGGFRVFRNLR